MRIGSTAGRIPQQPLIYLVVIGSLVSLVSSLALDPHRLFGIWKLSKTSSVPSAGVTIRTLLTDEEQEEGGRTREEGRRGEAGVIQKLDNNQSFPKAATAIISPSNDNNQPKRQESRAQIYRLLDDETDRNTLCSSSSSDDGDDEVLLQFNSDGSFRQCNEIDYFTTTVSTTTSKVAATVAATVMEGRWISGKWKLDPHQQLLIMAMNRQYFGPPFDVLLRGRIIIKETGKQDITNIQQYDNHLKENDNHHNCQDETAGHHSHQLGIQQGQIFKGQFIYPKTHPSFFDNDEPLMNQEIVGTFNLQQVLTTIAVFNQVQEQKQSVFRWKPSDLYRKSFYMMVEPIPTRQCGNRVGIVDDASISTRNNKLPINVNDINANDINANELIDIRTMSIQFFHNNTFQARAVNKILRGRFYINDQNQIAFDVSLFGSGRTAPGSVYSEGIGLSYDDKRSYVGNMIRMSSRNSSSSSQDDRLYIEGDVFFGTDLGSDARPEPVGKFQLTEVTHDENIAESSLLSDYDDDDEEQGNRHYSFE